MKIIVNLNDAEVNTLATAAKDVVDVIPCSVNHEDIDHHVDNFKHGIQHNPARYFAGGSLIGEYNPDDKYGEYTGVFNLDNDAFVTAIPALVKTLMLVWPVLAPFFSLVSALKALDKTIKESYDGIWESFKQKFQKPNLYAVVPLYNEELDVYGAAVIEKDGYGNDPGVVFSTTLSFDDRPHVENSLVHRLWKIQEEKDHSTKFEEITRESAEERARAMADDVIGRYKSSKEQRNAQKVLSDKCKLPEKEIIKRDDKNSEINRCIKGQCYCGSDSTEEPAKIVDTAYTVALVKYRKKYDVMMVKMTSYDNGEAIYKVVERTTNSVIPSSDVEGYFRKEDGMPTYTVFTMTQKVAASKFEEAMRSLSVAGEANSNLKTICGNRIKMD